MAQFLRTKYINKSKNVYTQFFFYFCFIKGKNKNFIFWSKLKIISIQANFDA
jgi:hypothetical protein